MLVNVNNCITYFPLTVPMLYDNTLFIVEGFAGQLQASHGRCQGLIASTLVDKSNLVCEV
jgi:hypothetical protein